MVYPTNLATNLSTTATTIHAPLEIIYLAIFNYQGDLILERDSSTNKILSSSL